MNTATATSLKGHAKHTFSIVVEIDQNWIDYLTQCGDILMLQYAGYWLRGVEHRSDLGWLCWEGCDKCFQGEEPNRTAASRAWAAGEPLPENWFRLDHAAAVRAWEEAVKRWGVDWYERTSSTREDIALQLALLGEVRYG